MKVAIYHPWIYLKSGLERTILELLQRSRHEWVVYTSHYDAEGTYPELKDYAIQEVNKVSVQRSYGAVLGASARIARTGLDLSSVDALVVCCDGVGSFITLRNAQRPILNLCFTPLRAVYDHEYRRRHLDRHRRRRWIALLLEQGYRVVDRWLWRRYSSVVCISDTVRERCTAANLYPANQMKVHYPGVDETAFAPGGTFAPFFFRPGRIMWTKNIELGIRAFQQFKATRGDYRLVVAGMVDEKSREYYEGLLELSGGDPDISFVLGPTDAEMQEYYRTCTAVLFTAFNEDLGLTPMEGMTKAKPVIAVGSGGPREVVAHRDTGYLVAADPNCFALAMEMLAGNPERVRAMGRQGFDRVQRFTWGRFVADMDAALEEMVAPRNG